MAQRVYTDSSAPPALQTLATDINEILAELLKKIAALEARIAVLEAA